MTAQIWKLGKQQQDASPPVPHSRTKKAALIGFMGLNVFLLCVAMVWILL